MTSCTLPSHSMAKPVWRQAMTSEWSPKMFSAWVDTVRAETWNTAGSCSAGDLVHIGDHQQQTLRGGVGGGQRTGAQRAVNCTGGAGLRLHLHHLDLRAEDVLQAVGGPLVHEVGHGGRRGDGVDGCNLRERIGNVRRCVVTIHGFHFSFHK